MNFVAVVIVSATVLGHPFNKTVVFLIGLNCILLCSNNNSQMIKKQFQVTMFLTFEIFLRSKDHTEKLSKLSQTSFSGIAIANKINETLLP